MEICNDGHDDVCYETAKCPACLTYEDGKTKGYTEGYADRDDEEN